MAASILLAVLFGGGLILIARWRIFGSRSCVVRFQPAMMRRKTVIVTGANSGIGKETTAGLLRLSARVIMACRDRSRAERAAAEIRDLVGSSEGELIIKQLDLSSLDSVRAFCNEIIQEEPRVDVLINNAGVYRCPYTRTHDGFEMQWGVNHLGHFLLTRLLTELLQKSAPSRVVVVSSKLYKNGSIEFEDVNGEGGYNAAFSYSQSKLANLLFSSELARQLEGTGVTANALSPGIVRTHLGRYVHVPPLAKPLLWLVSQLFFKSPAEGAKTSLYLACSPDVENITGKFFANCREEVLLPIATDDQVAQRLWDLSESMVGLKIKS